MPQRLVDVVFQDLAINEEEVKDPFKILKMVSFLANCFFDHGRSKPQLLEFWMFSFILMQIIPFENQIANLKVSHQHKFYQTNA